MLSYPILFAICVILLCFYLLNSIKERPKNFPPGPSRIPYWGNYLHIRKENYFHSHKALVKLHEKYNTELLGLFIGQVPVVAIRKYDLIKEVLWRDEFSDRADLPIIRNRGFGKLIGIFFSAGQFWKDQRWFSLRYLRDFGFGRRDDGIEDTIADEMRNFIEFLTSKPKPEDKDVCVETGIVKMPDAIYGPALNCVHYPISKTKFDDYKSMRNVGRAATNFLTSIDTTGSAINIAPWLRFFGPRYWGWSQSYEENAVLFDFAQKVVDEHKKTYDPECIRDFIDVFISEMNHLKKINRLDTSFTEEQLRYTVTDYMFPAPVGIGHTLNFLFAHLIINPEIQVKIQKEIDDVVGRARFPTINDRQNMHYTEASLREALRMDTLVPLSISRRATRDTTLGGYDIPAGTVILPNLWAMHNDPEMWGDPENFRPERWLDDKGHLLKKDWSLPFGAGKRLCAGETFARNTMFLFIGAIMQHFSLSVPKGHKLPEPWKHTSGITLTMPSYMMQVKLRD